ncbi:uncharacterized protein LOC142217258 [Leptodactylus fuscus]|uniref:uncharacterized protein LOC142217258 n=1 Tax=Leptodactylus fuscus TaxID=238119 RepID=UPI003F4E6285
MAVQLFNKTSFSATYQKGMIPAANEIVQLILSYVEKKTNGRALEMAVDVGCGTGRYTIPLASHFKKVLGTDISVSQINVAKEDSTPKNVFYLVAPAEKLPLRDASVDLVTAGLAAHWFNFDKFASEAIRVLKTNGCLAVHAYHPDMDIEYNDLSHELNVVLSEVWDTLYQYDDEKVTENMLSQYQQIFQAVLLKDKEWITNVPVTIQMSVSDLMWYIRSIYMSEAFMEKNIIKAEEFFIKTEKKYSINDTRLLNLPS